MTFHKQRRAETFVIISNLISEILSLGEGVEDQFVTMWALTNFMNSKCSLLCVCLLRGSFCSLCQCPVTCNRHCV